MVQATQEAPWYNRIATCGLMSSEYPAAIRYISWAFIVLGLIFIFPAAFLIALDIVIWVWRLCFNRNTVRPEETEERDARTASFGDDNGVSTARLTMQPDDSILEARNRVKPASSPNQLAGPG